MDDKKALINDLADYMKDIERTRTFGENLEEGLNNALSSSKFEGDLETILLDKIGEGGRVEVPQSLLRRVSDHKMTLGIQESRKGLEGSDIASRIAATKEDSTRFNGLRSPQSTSKQQRGMMEQ